MPNSIGRGIEWCDYMGGDRACYCEVERTSDYDWNEVGPETKCPDLGDWSDTPHDELDPENETEGPAKIIRQWWSELLIDLDRERLLSYIED
jgi:hypothetical protein